jgi:drug/metabolite transporter (DMT)-like permease
MNKAEHELRAYGALAAGVFCIAWSAILVRWTSMPGPASAFYRLIFALMVLSVLLLPFKRELVSMHRPTIVLALLGGAFFGADVALFNSAVLKTSAAIATLFANNAPLFVGLLTWVIWRRRPSLAFWVGLGLATAGSIFIFQADGARFIGSATGDWMAVSASFCFGTYLVITGRLRERVRTELLLGVSFLGSTLALLFYDLVTNTSLRIPGLRALAALLGLAIVCQLLGYFFLTYALGHLSSTVTSVTLLLIAPLTAVIALVLFGESIGGSQILGGVLVLIGVGLTNVVSSRRGRPGTVAYGS